MAGHKSKYGYGDIETGLGQPPALYPGIPAEENVLRWGFIRKVYGILSVQLVLTTLVSAIVVFTPAVTGFLQSNSWSLIFISILPLICESHIPTLAIDFSSGLCFKIGVGVAFHCLESFQSQS